MGREGVGPREEGSRSSEDGIESLSEPGNQLNSNGHFLMLRIRVVYGSVLTIDTTVIPSLAHVPDSARSFGCPSSIVLQSTQT